jgi:hypothetical protein
MLKRSRRVEVEGPEALRGTLLLIYQVRQWKCPGIQQDSMDEIAMRIQR